MSTQHKNIVEADLHEPKGASTSSINEVYFADGLGSGDFVIPVAHAACYHTATGGTSDTPALADTWEVLGLTTTANGLVEFTHTSPSKFTYTGAADRHAMVTFNMSFEATSVAGTALFAVYLNGVKEAASESRRYFANGTAGVVSIDWDLDIVTGDYIEIWWAHETTARACTIYHTYMTIQAHVEN